MPGYRRWYVQSLYCPFLGHFSRVTHRFHGVFTALHRTPDVPPIPVISVITPSDFIVGEKIRNMDEDRQTKLEEREGFKRKKESRGEAISKITFKVQLAQLGPK